MKHERYKHRILYQLTRFFRWTSRLNIQFSHWFIDETDVYVAEYRFERDAGISLDNWRRLERVLLAQNSLENKGCENCGARYNLTIDHKKKPGEEGFSNEYSNLEVRCLACVANPEREVRWLKVQ